jgi:gliding motility-associated-like protein
VFCELVIPNTFSPNDDGFNDTWIIENLINYTEAKLKVYNRWGDIVFTSTGYDTPWEGKSAGANLPAAVYYYVLEVPEIDKNYAGQLTIVR